MKKYTALLLALLMLLTACGSTQEPIDGQPTGSEATETGTTEATRSDPANTTEVTEPATEATAAPTEPVTTEPTEPVTTEPATEATTAPTEPAATEPTTKPTEPATEPTTAPTEPPTTPPTEPTPNQVTLKLDTDYIEIIAGETKTLTATYSGTASSPTWKSSNTSVATVDSNGKVTAKAAGTATITAEYGGKSATCSVTVNKPAETPSFAIVTPKDTEFYVGDTLTLNYTYSGDKAALKVDTSNASILTIKNNGGNIIVTGVSEGKASVAIYSGSTKLGQVRLSVVNKPVEKPTEPEIGPAVSISKYGNNGPWNSGMVGNHMSFSAVVKTANGDNREVVATSSNTGVATVSCSMGGGIASIKVTYKAAGSATITIKSDDGKVSDSFTINVSNYSSRSVSSPEEYAAAATYVMTANGMSQAVTGSYTVLVLSPGELSWSRAVGTGQDLARRSWANGRTSGSVTYEGTNEDGNYIFHLRN